MTTMCTTWITGVDVAECCSTECDNPSIFNSAAEAASDVLFQLSGRMYPGTCETVARPCRTSCGCPWQVLSRGHIVWNNQYWGYGYPYTGWWGDDGGGCAPESSVKLSGYPVQSIDEVKINGLVVDPLTYHLERGRYLVRNRDPADPSVVLRWPGCQAMDLEDTEDGTFSVSYTSGPETPQIAIDAASQLACELTKACVGEQCELPAGTFRVVRQGVSIEKLPFVGFAWSEGRIAGQTRGWHTGLSLVDAFLNSHNPGGLKRRPIFWSPSQTHRYAKIRQMWPSS